ncbi:MAG: RNA methyltransferase, partial [Planctomycetes bacterium]|nr:RNA methyltransferase [Planctomycetota bacterium]
EHQGLEPSTMEALDVLVRIPMAAGVDSLNVAAAGAIALYEIEYGVG